MTNIAFIGLGIMGAPMAVNLAKAGFSVTGHNRSPRYDALIEVGGRSADSVAEAVADADVIITMVPDSPDVAAVLQGEHGVFASAKAGALIIDFSTIRPDVAQELAAEAKGNGLRMLDAPVSGGEPGAINGALSIMVGGDAADFGEASPVFEAVGKTIVHVGPSGSGQTVKAANQLIVATNIAALSEAVVFLEAYGVDLPAAEHLDGSRQGHPVRLEAAVVLEAYGVDLPAAIKVLGGGLAGSAVLNQKAQKILDRDFAPGFRIDLHHKDMGIVTAAAREAGVAIPVGALLAQLMVSARGNGDGDLDHSGLFRTTQRLSGTQTR